ncbi:hypothetical protein M427DRAFT_54727 [Gonapodya prolifera JEL478]|uniref:Uncharacterized protein n=1 Tax=Gonapodya prolifera (strain JEL478) TaxID=1344416 RepID=A0A139AKZ1_GONPJ|nr:hypothetical protein M427DRAFT_54727 [Gonapodya prolifera JEL478]|eukprot:KXS17459.1 hypothetical protein M427DRAFT_54727 [Gonapodya prolifera JEL478]
MDRSSLELAGMAVMSTRQRQEQWRRRILLQAALTLATSIIPRERPTFPSTHMDLDAMTPADCRLRFRFDKTDMPRLQQALHVPAIVSTDNRLIVPGIEVLCVVLHRLSLPTRLDDLGKEFGRKGSKISRVYQWSVTHICTLFSDVLYWDKDRLTSEVLQEYADAVRDAGAP